MAKILRPTAVVLGIALALACTPPEERAEQAREAVAESIARGDREAAVTEGGGASPELRAHARQALDALP